MRIPKIRLYVYIACVACEGSQGPQAIYTDIYDLPEVMRGLLYVRDTVFSGFYPQSGIYIRTQKIDLPIYIVCVACEGPRKDRGQYIKPSNSRVRACVCEVYCFLVGFISKVGYTWGPRKSVWLYILPALIAKTLATTAGNI